MRENLLVVTGNNEVKELKDMLPDIIKQVGPQQYEALKNMMGDFGKKAAGKQEDDDEDDVPPLVQGTFEDAQKKKWANIQTEFNQEWAKDWDYQQASDAASLRSTNRKSWSKHQFS